MRNDDHVSGANSQDLDPIGAEPVASIEDLLRERGFFDSTKPAREM
jgi:hypothetical protein